MQSLISVDLGKRPEDQPVPLHNRWHPDIPPVVSVNPGEVFRVECMDWTGGQIGNNDSANDVRDVDLTRVHMLSGPITVNGAEPGDLLVVDVLDIGTTWGWGFTGIFAKENGGGFLTNHFPEARKAIWDIQGVYATSRHVRGVRFAGISHPGLMGTAPSQELLNQWNTREKALIDTNPDRVPPLAAPPNPSGALLGQIKPGTSDWDRIAREGARTIPPRENGGNVDIKNLSRGSRVYFPVWVRGANLSMGDLHFSQGDGEITFCGAIEMAGYLDLHVDVIKDGMSKYGVTNNPIFQPGPMDPRHEQFLTFEGVSVDEQGRQHYLDPFVAYHRACLNAVNYLQCFGYSGEQAYVILGTAPVEGRISGIVDIPNACCTVYVPTAIFDFDIRPSAAGPITADRGHLAMPS